MPYTAHPAGSNAGGVLSFSVLFLNYLQDCSRGWQEGGCLCTCLLAISTPLIANMDHVTYANIFHEIEFRSIHSILYVTTSSEVQPRSCQHSTNEAAHYRLNVALVGRPPRRGWVDSAELPISSLAIFRAHLPSRCQALAPQKLCR